MDQNSSLGSAGSVTIEVRGDLSKLSADFAAAQNLAQKAGASVASSFTSGSSSIVSAQDRAKQATKNLADAQTQLAAFVVAGNKEAIAAVAGYQAELKAAQSTLAGFTASQEAAAAGESTFAASTNAATTAVVRQNAALHGSVSELQAVSGTIRTLDGNGGIRAAERFLTMIPGIGAALQVAFPLIGALALGEVITRTILKFNELSEAEKHLAEVTKQTDAEWEKLAERFERTDVSRITAQFGELQGLKLQGFYDKATAERDRIEIDNTARKIEQAKKILSDTQSLYSNSLIKSTVQDFNPLIVGQRIGQYTSAGSEKDQIAKIKELQQNYDLLVEKVRVFNNEQKGSEEKKVKVSAEESGQSAAGRISNQEQALTREAEMAKKVADLQIAQSHAVEQVRIAAIHDPEAATLAAAQEDLRVAQAKEKAITAQLEAELPKRIDLIRKQGAAESQGKTPIEQGRIAESTRGKVENVEGEAARQTFDAYSATIAAQNALDVARAGLVKKQAAEYESTWREAFDAIAKNAKETEAIQTKAVSESLATFQQVSRIETRSKIRVEGEQIEGQKLQLERQAGLEIGQTLTQRIALTRELITLDEQGRQKQLEDLQAQLETANSIEDEKEQKIEVARVQGQINELEARGNNARIQAQIELDRLTKQQDLRRQIGSDVFRAGQQVPGAIAGGLAKGIIDGKGIGRDIRESLKGVGQELLGAAFKQIISELIIKLGLQAAATAVLGTVFGASTSAQVTADATLEAATALNTVAVHANTLAQLKSAASGVAGGVAGAAGGGVSAAAGAAASGLVGPLIAAAGGVIGGVISGVMSLIGAHSIVKAVNATTAAVLSLKSSGIRSDSKLTDKSATSSSSSVSAKEIVGGVTDSLSHIPFLAGILGGFGLGNGTPVRIVGIDPGVLAGFALAGSIFGGIGSLFGFAEGGRPAPGVPYIVGEKGPELRVDDKPGTIIPAGKFSMADAGKTAAHAMPGGAKTPAFAEGGRPVPGVPYIAGEKGPELRIDDGPGISTATKTVHGAGALPVQQSVQAGSASFVQQSAGAAGLNGANGIPGLQALNGLNGINGLPGKAGLNPALNVNLPFLGLPSPDAVVNQTPPQSARSAITNDGTTIHLHGAQFHGVQNVRELMREVAQYAKTQSPKFSPYAK